MSVKDVLVELERQFWESAGNQPFYEQKFATDGLMAFSIGLMSKADVVESMRGAPEWESFTFGDLRFVQIADDVGAIAYTTTAVSSGEPDPYAAAVISVYARRDGEWQLVLHQQTPLVGQT